MAIPTADPIIVAPTPNPVKADDSIDFDKLARNIRRWLDTELSGFVVGSYGGEEFHIGEPDKVQAIRTVAEAHGGRRFVIAGIDSPSPTEAVRLAHLYAEAGADMVRVRIPAPTQTQRAAVSNVEYFRHVARRSPVPIVVIHQPKDPGKVDTTPEELGEITNLGNIYAYINSLNFRWEQRCVPFIASGVKYWTCNGSLLYPGASVGAIGACLFFGNWGASQVQANHRAHYGRPPRRSRKDTEIAHTRGLPRHDIRSSCFEGGAEHARLRSDSAT